MAEHVCPVWVGYLLASPIRRLFQKPEDIVGEYVNEGMTVLDVGSAMGYFSIPMAGMVGSSGRVICVDMQEKMFRSLKKRAKKAAVLDRIELRACSGEDLAISDLGDKVDFALAFAMVHEAPNIDALLGGIFDALRPGGRLLISEPKGHVSQADFEETLTIAGKTGFNDIGRPSVKRGLSVLLQKPC
ncbi:MAG: class I SAM-dependent methyltransferase [Deltaproteobacteria bacterium]|nr:class I SAM-dependent methyltransferase [Deltaproteobacteria bacterium]